MPLAEAWRLKVEAALMPISEGSGFRDKVRQNKYANIYYNTFSTIINNSQKACCWNGGTKDKPAWTALLENTAAFAELYRNIYPISDNVVVPEIILQLRDFNLRLLCLKVVINAARIYLAQDESASYSWMRRVKDQEQRLMWLESFARCYQELHGRLKMAWGELRILFPDAAAVKKIDLSREVDEVNNNGKNPVALTELDELLGEAELITQIEDEDPNRKLANASEKNMYLLWWEDYCQERTGGAKQNLLLIQQQLYVYFSKIAGGFKYLEKNAKKNGKFHQQLQLKYADWLRWDGLCDCWYARLNTTAPVLFPQLFSSPRLRHAIPPAIEVVTTSGGCSFFPFKKIGVGFFTLGSAGLITMHILILVKVTNLSTLLFPGIGALALILIGILMVVYHQCHQRHRPSQSNPVERAPLLR